MISLQEKYIVEENVAFIIESAEQVDGIQLSKTELEYVKKRVFEKAGFIHVNSYYKSSFVVVVDPEKQNCERYEFVRDAGCKITKILTENKADKLNIIDLANDEYSLALAEGAALSSYSFSKYFKDKSEKESSLKTIKIVSDKLNSEHIIKLNAIIIGVKIARDIVNEPVSYMTALKLSQEVEGLGKKYGFSTEVLHKKQIESLKMGGLIAVNRGSVDPPTFSILKWEPQNAINSSPIVLVGKGLVFDTGGINLKPSGSLETMKSDKSGAAAVIGAIAAISEAKLPVKIIGLIPATDNRPGNNAYVPQDVITMFDGTNVEVLNTDAEGRLILADALAYAKNYKPSLVIDLATLTGAAVVAVGERATAIMGNDPITMQKLKTSGFDVWERLAELPFWDDYKEQLKSEVADIKNIGGKYAGAITAGKFLEHFTDYKWVHLDIAGPAFSEKNDSYRGNGGTGVGVRLLFDFINKCVENNCK